MEIISLNSEDRNPDPEESSRRRAAKKASASVTTDAASDARSPLGTRGRRPETGFDLRVTDIKSAVKNENRVNIFVNDKYDFSLDIAQLVDFKLKVGQVLSAEDLEKYHKASNYGKLYQRTLEWVLSRPHSIREAKDYLFKKHAEKADEQKILETLSEKGYLNDEAFAKFYVENRFVKKGISKKRLQLELQKKGVAKEIIDEALSSSDRTDEAEIKKIIAKKRNKYDDEKLISYLVRQGFSYQLSKDLVLGTD